MGIFKLPAWTIFVMVLLLGGLGFFAKSCKDEKDTNANLSARVTELETTIFNQGYKINRLVADSSKWAGKYADCRREASDQKVEYYKQLTVLQAGAVAAKRKAETTSGNRLKPAVLDNLAQGGFYKPNLEVDSLPGGKLDTTGQWQIDFSETQSRAILEATEAGRNAKKAWDDMANGVATLTAENNTLKSNLANAEQSNTDCQDRERVLLDRINRNRQRGIFGKFKCWLFGCK